MSLRAGAVIALVMAAIACAPTAAHAQSKLLTPEDAADLAQSLADAQEDQGICYGWYVGYGAFGPEFADVGSGRGPEERLQPDSDACPKGHIELVGRYDYACDSCDGSDTASIEIDSSFANAPTEGDLEKLGLKADDLVGDNDDTALINMVSALPLLAADRGLAPYLAYEPATDVPAADRATDTPGSDLLRDDGTIFLLCGALILAGPAFYLYKLYQGSH